MTPQSRTGHGLFIRVCLVAAACAAVVFSAPPPVLPGAEITGEVSSSIRPDTAGYKAPASSPYAPEWYIEAAKTWDAPPLSRQLDEDETPIPIGKGAVFISRLSDPTLEPDVQIADSSGRVIMSGKPGRKFFLVPGTYSISMGNGSVRQRITKWVTVDEGKVIPLYPTWAGLAVDVVSESNIPFRGSYELARIDEFEPFGRTYSRDPNQGERIKTWILKPGLYKLFGVGETYNTVNSYVTVRLLPGELVHFTVVQDSVTGKIISGGVTYSGEASRSITSYWKYGLDIGGSILFNTSNDTNNSAIVSITNLRVNHTRSKGEWDTKFFFDEELNFSDFNISQINNTSDDFRIYSLYVWRLMHWFGPYGRMQFETSFFPVYDRFQESSQLHLFLQTRSDSTIESADSASKSLRLKPSLSPMSVDLGVGANVDAITAEDFDMKFKLGFGYSQRNTWNQERDMAQDTTAVKTLEDNPTSIFDSVQLNSLLSRYKANFKIVQRQSNNTVRSYGPETSINASARVGRWITAEGEVIVLFPIGPILQEHSIRPNYRVNTIISWRIAKAVTLDYLYMYQYSQPLKTDVKVDLSQHRVWLRYSFNSFR
jgi:hypothetical protein